MGRSSALLEKELLAQGDGGNLVEIGHLFGQTSTNFSQFEICSTFFLRKLTFYPGDYRVIIQLTGPKAKIIEDMPNYFHLDTANCGDELVWDREKMAEFVSLLSTNSGFGMAQEWYNTFDLMVSTVQLTDVPTPTPSSESTSMIYKNDTYGFSLSYDPPYQLLTDAENLYGYPNGVALFYTGGQAYDIVVEVWDTKAAYEAEYASRMAELTVVEHKGKFITLLNNTGSAANQTIIDSLVLLP
jgi:hypothetical protein